MSRIDVQTLVLCFEKRIEALEKNPPDKVPTQVIINLLEKSIDEILKEHFLHLIKEDLAKAIKQQFKEIHKAFIDKTIEQMLTDSEFRENLAKKMKDKIVNSIKI